MFHIKGFTQFINKVQFGPLIFAYKNKNFNCTFYLKNIEQLVVNLLRSSSTCPLESDVFIFERFAIMQKYPSFNLLKMFILPLYDLTSAR